MPGFWPVKEQKLWLSTVVQLPDTNQEAIPLRHCNGISRKIPPDWQYHVDAFQDQSFVMVKNGKKTHTRNHKLAFVHHYFLFISLVPPPLNCKRSQVGLASHFILVCILKLLAVCMMWDCEKTTFYPWYSANAGMEVKVCYTV